MVNRNDLQEKQWLSIKTHAVRVSRALWPADTRRVATGKAAQRRRKLIVRHRRSIYLLDLLQIRNPIMLVALSLLLTVSIITALSAHVWYPLFCSLVLFIVLLMLPLFVATEAVHSNIVGSQLLQEMRSLPGIATKLLVPDTPLPAEPPLVRVLDTVDLSQTDVEHFLATPDEQTGDTAAMTLNWWKEREQKAMHRF